VSEPGAGAARTGLLGLGPGARVRRGEEGRTLGKQLAPLLTVDKAVWRHHARATAALAVIVLQAPLLGRLVVAKLAARGSLELGLLLPVVLLAAARLDVLSPGDLAWLRTISRLAAKTQTMGQALLRVRGYAF